MYKHVYYYGFILFLQKYIVDSNLKNELIIKNKKGALLKKTPFPFLYSEILYPTNIFKILPVSKVFILWENSETVVK